MSAKKKAAPPMKARRKNDGPRDDDDPNHINGKRYGGSRTADGIRIAPCLQGRFDAAMELEDSVREILDFQNRLALRAMTASKEAARSLWQEVAENYDIDLSEGWAYRRVTGELVRNPAGPRTMNSKDAEEKKP